MKITTKKKSEKAITLIALVVTIIVLLILAGVAISMLAGDNGILRQAALAKERTEIAQEQERLDLEKQELVLQKKDGNITVDEYIDHLKGKGIIEDESDITDNEDGSKDIITDNGFSANVRPGEREGEVIVVVEGKAGNLPIRITDLKLTPTSSSINIEVKAKRAEGAKYKYYVKEENGEYPENPDNEGESATYEKTGLIKDKTYTVKVEATDTKGNTDTKEKSIKTGEILTADGAVIINDVKWDTTFHTASVLITSENTDYQLQWSTDDKDYKTIESGQRATGLHHNDTVYVKFYDGTNRGEGYASLGITDDQNPNEATFTEFSATEVAPGEEVTITVTQSDDQSGIVVGNCKWEFNTQEGNIGENEENYTHAFESEKEEITINTTDLEPNTYYLHVLSVDQAGKKKETVKGSVEIKKPISISEVNEDNVADYLGKKVTNYKGKSSVDIDGTTYEVSQDYRLYYIDYEGKYGEKDTIYLKAETNGKDYNLPNTEEALSEDDLDKQDKIKIKKLNPELYKDSRTGPSTSNNGMKAVTWLTNTDHWKGLADTRYTNNEINYIVGSPSVEMMMDSYNKHYNLTGDTPEQGDMTEDSPRKKLFYKQGKYGYQVGPGSSAQYDEYTAYYSVKSDIIDTMYYPRDSRGYWLTSPIGNRLANMASVVGIVYCYGGGLVSCTYYSDPRGLCPLVSLKPTVQLELEP